MLGWGVVAGVVVAVEAALTRRQAPLLSHTYWGLLDTRNGSAAVAGWAALTWHLHVPNRKWRRALAFGSTVGVAHWLSTREET